MIITWVSCECHMVVHYLHTHTHTHKHSFIHTHHTHAHILSKVTSTQSCIQYSSRGDSCLLSWVMSGDGPLFSHDIYMCTHTHTHTSVHAPAQTRVHTHTCTHTQSNNLNSICQSKLDIYMYTLKLIRNRLIKTIPYTCHNSLIDTKTTAIE